MSTVRKKKPSNTLRSELDWDGLFDCLGQASLQVAMVVIGGGSGALAHCLRRPGASSIFVEAMMPYSRLSTASYLTIEPRGSSASPERAHQLAATALARAEALTDRELPYETVGLALVAALPTVTPRRGADRINVALHTSLRRTLWSVELTKGDFDRQSAESVAEEMVCLALSHLRPDRTDESSHTEPILLRCGLTVTRKQSVYR